MELGLTIIRLARVRFISASLALYTLGAFWAVILGAPLDWARLLLGYLIVFPGHLSVAFSNQYYDVEVDKFGHPAAFNGGTGVLVLHPELRRPARQVAILLILCSMVMAGVYQVLYSPPIWFIGYVALCNFLGWFYTAPPLKLSYRGWGEFSTAFTAGFLVPAMGILVMQGFLSADGLIFTIPLLLYGLGFILAVEIPDLEADRRGHKQTWVVQKGRGFGFTLVGAFFCAASVFFILFAWFFPGMFSINFYLLGIFSFIPFVAGVAGAIRRPQDQPTAGRFTNGIIISLILFFIMTDGYILITALQS